jgi:hypothetical protein
MEMTMLEKMKTKFMEFGYDFPNALQFIFSHNLLGEDMESSLEPWGNAWIESLAPIKKLFPKSKMKRDIFPFAKRQDMDHLACIEKETGKVLEIHYDTGNPKFIDITDEFESVWEWLTSVIDDIQLFWDS